jgi:hypothetical protein
MSCRLRQQFELSKVSMIDVIRETMDDAGFHTSAGGVIFAASWSGQPSGGVSPARRQAPLNAGNCA